MPDKDVDQFPTKGTMFDRAANTKETVAEEKVHEGVRIQDAKMRAEYKRAVAADNQVLARQEQVQIKNLFQRIIQVYTQVETVVKDDTVSMGSGKGYKAVSHDAVTSVLHRPIAKAGIVLWVTQKSSKVEWFEQTKVKAGWNGAPDTETKVSGYRADVTVLLTLINADDPKDRMDAEFSAFSFDSGDKCVGKAMSMAVKMGLLKIFMLESLDQEESREFEGNDYSKAPPKPQPHPAAQQRPPPNRAPGADRPPFGPSMGPGK